MNRVCLTKDEIHSTLNHYLNGAEREDLSGEISDWLEKGINMAVEDLMKIGGKHE